LTSESISLSGSSFQGITTPITFRVYAYGTASAYEVFENLNLNGSTAAVPEPTSMAYFGLGGLSLAAWLRRKK
jgi:hypothetical protein